MGGYWLGYWFGDSRSIHNYTSVAGTGRWVKNTYSSTANAPTTLHLNTSDGSYSINATYTS